MGAILIGMPKQEDASHIAEVLRSSGIAEEIVSCQRGADVLRRAEETDVSLVICTRHFSDMGYEEMTTYLPSSASVLLLTKDATLVPFSANVIRLLMPFKRGDLISTVQMCLPYRPFFIRKKKPPERPPEERKIIEEAKSVLMNRNEMSEPEAFRYLQKSSMDTGRTLLESAQMILLLNDG